MKWPDLMEKARNVKPVARSMKAKLEDAAQEIGFSGVLAGIRSEERYCNHD
jgi:hypothetical protein